MRRQLRQGLGGGGGGGEGGGPLVYCRGPGGIWGEGWWALGSRLIAVITTAAQRDRAVGRRRETVTNVHE